MIYLPGNTCYQVLCTPSDWSFHVCEHSTQISRVWMHPCVDALEGRMLKLPYKIREAAIARSAFAHSPATRHISEWLRPCRRRTCLLRWCCEEVGSLKCRCVLIRMGNYPTACTSLWCLLWATSCHCSDEWCGYIVHMERDKAILTRIPLHPDLFRDDTDCLPFQFPVCAIHAPMRATGAAQCRPFAGISEP